MKPIFEPSAQDFLDAQRHDAEFADLFNHILDEVRLLRIDPTIDGEDKFIFPVQYLGKQSYRIYWGSKFRRRSFWYIYEPDYNADELRIYNIGEAGIERPFLSRR